MAQKAGTRTGAAGRLALVAVVLAIGCATPGPAAADSHEMKAASEDLTAIVRGGRLYDDWQLETNRPTPPLSHPAYPADMVYADAPRINWRCAECHGYDYKGKDGANATGIHYTGIKGIRDMQGADPKHVMEILTDGTHRYQGYLSEQDIRDLALFVAFGQVDMDTVIDSDTGRAKGVPDRRLDFYQTICATCHGYDGLMIKNLPAFGVVAREDPWNALHKMLNGHPGELMPALRAFEMQTVVDILAYVQTLPTQDEMSSVVRGGRLYDNWFKEVDAPPPAEPHPAYPRSAEYAKYPRNNWRCKECHGWDYKGKDGAYGKGIHYTGIKGITAMAGADPEKIVAVLHDGNHRYGAMLTEQDLVDLANFVSKGQIDMDVYIDRKTNKARGDSKRQAAFYKTICATCHGADGRMQLTQPPLGRLANNSPWDAMHKMLNGHPDGNMPPLRVLGLQTLVDILAYAQTLPTRK